MCAGSSSSTVYLSSGLVVDTQSLSLSLSISILSEYLHTQTQIFSTDQPIRLSNLSTAAKEKKQSND